MRKQSRTLTVNSLLSGIQIKTVKVKSQRRKQKKCFRLLTKRMPSYPILRRNASMTLAGLTPTISIAAWVAWVAWADLAACQVVLHLLPVPVAEWEAWAVWVVAGQEAWHSIRTT
jgi:hypothetical protein